MAKGKGKGSAFEREIAKRLSLWFTHGENDSIYWRTSNSGGRATTRKKLGKKDKYHHGDLCATDPIGQPLLDVMSIEIKRGYAKVTVADMLDKPPGAAKQEWEKWIEQAKTSAANAGSLGWLLISRRNQRSAIVFISEDLFDELQNVDPRLIFDDPTFEMSIDNYGVIGTTLENFLTSVTPEMIIQLAEIHG